MSQRSKVTITEIAERVGLNTITVSRALNEPHLVKPTTRDRILAAASGLAHELSSDCRSHRDWSDYGLSVLQDRQP